MNGSSPAQTNQKKKEGFANWRTGEMSHLEGPERCFSCDEMFTDFDQVALVSTESGWMCELPGDLAKHAVWEPGDVEAFHKACWEQLGITKVSRC